MSYYQRVGLVEEGKPITQQCDDAQGELSHSMHGQSSSSNFRSASILNVTHTRRYQNDDEEYKRHMATLEAEYQKTIAQEGSNGEHGLLWDSQKIAGIGKESRGRSENMQGAFQSEANISSLSKASSLSSHANTYGASKKHPKKKMVTSFVIGGAKAKAKTHSSALYNNNNPVMEVDHENDHYHHHHHHQQQQQQQNPQHQADARASAVRLSPAVPCPRSHPPKGHASTPVQSATRHFSIPAFANCTSIWKVMNMNLPHMPMHQSNSRI
mmetsp:Transcript_14046/g.20990  ORF Transcript_14046/g.20990 Transcript_14046/m.20990 type:complete len:269 (+) Transcript_14046:202-1008(+)